MEGLPHINLRKFITPERINSLFEKYDVPHEIDVLSIDIDSTTTGYEGHRRCTKFSAKILIIEYNSHVPPDEARVVEYDTAGWDGRTSYFGAGMPHSRSSGSRTGHTATDCSTATRME